MFLPTGCEACGSDYHFTWQHDECAAARAVCADIRLSGVPAEWPPEQTWIGLPDLRDGRHDITQVTCARCAQIAPGIVTALQQIGAKK